jgi:hypothetical protein
MSDAKMPRKNGSKRKPTQPAPPSEPTMPEASKSLAPWEVTEQMTDEQLDDFADGLMRLFEKAQAKNNPS